MISVGDLLVLHKPWKFEYFRKQQDLIKTNGETLLVYIQSAALLWKYSV